MKQKEFKTGQQAFIFNQAHFDENISICKIVAITSGYIMDDKGNRFTKSSDDRDYLTAEGNRTIRLYMTECAAKEALERIRITNWINQHMKKLPSSSLHHLQMIIKCLEDSEKYKDIKLDTEILLNALSVYQTINQIEPVEPLSKVTELALQELLQYRSTTHQKY